jgi:phage terminase large subunit-like protein
MAKPISPVLFIDKLIKKNELGQPFKLTAHQREILDLAFQFDDDGRLSWDMILYSCVKKSGKTALNAALTLYWAFVHESPNTCLFVANDLEQARARAFASCEGMI